jgi:alkylhydroperoxidase family enzyme
VKALKNPALVQAALEDYRTAAMGDGLRATLGFLEKLTLEPQSVGPEDVARVRAAGVKDRGIRDAIYICTLFCTIDRIADGLGFVPNDASGLKWVARILLGPGYAAGVVE